MSMTLWAIRCVWLRYFSVFRMNLFYGLFTTFVEPLLFLASFGFGLGSMIPDIHVNGVTVTYRQFVLAGILGQTVLFQSFFEAAYGGFVRMYYQKIFLAMAMTPITLKEVLWGELIWDASKSTFAAFSVLVIGVALGDFSVSGAFLIGLPAAFIASLLFSAFGLLAAARASTIDVISYPQYIVIFPMFLFCGVFFPIENLPILLQKVAWILPLTPFLSISRAATIGTPWDWLAVPELLLWTLVFVPIALRGMHRRLVH
jgi:lipooligosaccharide transport system permease protein